MPADLSRRQLLVAGLGLAGTALLVGATGGVAAAAPAVPAGPAGTAWRGGRSANGWPIVDAVTPRRANGSDAHLATVDGDVADILEHVVRRFSYEIDALRDAEVTGHVTDRVVQQDYESNYLSGTAIAIRPLFYPVGAAGGLFPNELVVVRDILADCRGVVRWGGDEKVPKESHFQIDLSSGYPKVAEAAERIIDWNA